MVNGRKYFSVIRTLIGQFVLLAISIQTTESNDNETKKDLLYMKSFDTSSAISGILSRNWTENHECLVELNRIRDGYEKYEEWAMKVLDSWGNFPSGVLDGNSFEAGSFSECFHIERNGQQYRTQYCHGNLFVTVPNSRGFRPRISLGICLPASCSVGHLESVVNDVIRPNAKNITVTIPRNMCQLEETPTNWNTMDYVTIGLCGVALLILASSTGYDLFSTIHNRVKHPPFVLFSMYTNGKKLFACIKPKVPSSTIECIEGIRVLSTMWVIFIHTYRFLVYLGIPIRNKTTVNNWMKTYRSAFLNTAIPVDSFLTISGLLVSYKMLKLIQKDGKLDILSLYWQRYLRLTPLVAAAVLVELASLSMFHSFCSGPFWPIWSNRYVSNCRNNWWSTLLFVQNYVHPNDMCIGASWYLGVDMQLYIISPVIVYLIYRFKKTTITTLVGLLLGSICYMTFVYIDNNFTIHMQRGYKEKYVATHIRFPAWLIGFIAGYIMLEFPTGSIRMSKKLNLFAMSLSIILMAAAVLGDHPFYQATPVFSPFVYGLFDALSRVLWSIALCYLIFACKHGYGGPINWMLSLPMWQPISRLSYAIYLIHAYVIIMLDFSYQSPPYFSEFGLIRDFVSNFVMCTFLAIPFTFAFELPIDAFNKLTNGLNKKNMLPVSSAVKSSDTNGTAEQYRCTKFKNLHN